MIPFGSVLPTAEGSPGGIGAVSKRPEVSGSEVPSLSSKESPWPPRRSIRIPPACRALSRSDSVARRDAAQLAAFPSGLVRPSGIRT